MKSTLGLPALALAGALALAACGNGGQGAAGAPPSSASQHGGGHGGGTDSGTAKGNDADIAFLSGMKPHHEQAVEMSDLVLATNPPAEVAALAQRVKDAQAPEIEQMETMLADLGQEAPAEHGAGHSGGPGDAHGGMMSEQEMAALGAATGSQAARLYLEGMIEHHQGAIEASEKQLADGGHEPALRLAEQIKTAQAAEISEMQTLLQSL